MKCYCGEKLNLIIRVRTGHQVPARWVYLLGFFYSVSSFRVFVDINILSLSQWQAGFLFPGSVQVFNSSGVSIKFHARGSWFGWRAENRENDLQLHVWQTALSCTDRPASRTRHQTLRGRAGTQPCPPVCRRADYSCDQVSHILETRGTLMASHFCFLLPVRQNRSHRQHPQPWLCPQIHPGLFLWGETKSTVWPVSKQIHCMFVFLEFVSARVKYF